MKILLIKIFKGDKDKLKRFLIQIKIKINNKGLGLLILMEQVVYVGLFLIGKASEWFKYYFTNI